MIPGSHKSEVPRPETLYNGGDLENGAPTGVVNITAQAGDAIVISELLTHGALRWTPQDRKRVVLVLRYAPHFKSQHDYLIDEIRARLSPETIELMAPAGAWEEKNIAKQDVVNLS